jgi:methionyl-tRNA formyltransferase
MRVVFLGTPEIAVPPLKSLLDHSYDVRGVFTQPDRPSGRGQKLKPSSVKKFAQEKGIPVFQPEKIRSEENKEIIDRLDPDFLIVAAISRGRTCRLCNSHRRGRNRRYNYDHAGVAGFRAYSDAEKDGDSCDGNYG